VVNLKYYCNKSIQLGNSLIVYLLLIDCNIKSKVTKPKNTYPIWFMHFLFLYYKLIKL